MATVNFSVPDDVKEAFNAAFSGQNKSAIIADLMREAVERARRQQQSREATARIRRRRTAAPTRSSDELQVARDKGRP